VFKEKIFKLLDDSENVLVFPTENSARHYLSAYVRDRKRPVAASSAISFDTFLARFETRPENLKPINVYERHFFAYSFLLERGKDLKYFFKDACIGNEKQFASSFSKMASELNDRLERFVSNKDELSDLLLLRAAYTEYLEKNSLYEPMGYLHDVKIEPKENYYLVGFDAEGGMQRFLSEVGRCGKIHKVCLEGDDVRKDSKYFQFANQNQELRSLFDDIRDKISSGAMREDFAIATPDVDALRPFLERLSYEYGIPLSFSEPVGLPLTNAGKYLNQIKEIYSGDYSFQSLSPLLLNQALPYTEEKRDLANKLVSHMIDYKLVEGSRKYGKEDRIFKTLGGKPELQSFYSSIKAGINGVNEAGSFAPFIKSLRALTVYLFGEAEFSAMPNEANVYSFLLNEFGKAGEALRGDEVDSFFSFFFALVWKGKYTRQQKEDGIRVEKYGNDYLVDVRHRYVVSLSEKNSERMDSEYGFLGDYEVVPSSRFDIDTTESVLTYYSSLSENVWLSGSLSTFTEEASAPPSLVRDGRVEAREYAPSSHAPYMASVSHGIASKKSMRKRKVDSRASKTMEILTDKPTLTATLINDYQSCPFWYYAEKVVFSGGRGQTEFVPSDEEYNNIGTFLHSVLEVFMRGKKERGEKINVGDDKNDIAKIFEEKLDDPSYGFRPFVKASLRSRYLEGIIACLDAFDECEVVMVEDKGVLASEDFGTCFLRGVPDLVVKRPEGSYEVIDFKRANGQDKAKTYQLMIYRKILGMKTGECYSGGIYDISKSTLWAENAKVEEFDGVVDSIVQSIEDNEFAFVDASKGCGFCPYRQFCRGRFADA